MILLIVEQGGILIELLMALQIIARFIDTGVTNFFHRHSVSTQFIDISNI